MVYVISKDGQPLMPTVRHGKVRRLLNTGKAKVIRRCPFTIKLLYDTTKYTQDLTLGVDTGSGTAGMAVSDDNGNILYASKVTLRDDISDKLTARRKYRRNRRGNKTRYRKPRFLNRGSSRREDRFSPTMTSKLHSHEKEIRFIQLILPVKRIVIETGQFDPHLMKHEGEAFNRHWGYQKGQNYGFENTKAMVLNRDGYTCQCCKGKHKDPKLEVHHIVYQSQGGSDEADNLITLCHTCHKAVHEGRLITKFKGKVKGALKYATQMNSIRKQMLKHHPEAIETFGYITKANREKAGLPKDHHIDAGMIASGGKPIKYLVNTIYLKRCIPKGDFQKTKGVRSEQPITTGKIAGFKKYDKVKYQGCEYFIKGRMSTGYAILMDIEGRKVDFSHMPKGKKTPKLSNCKRLEARSSWMVTTGAVTQNTA